MDATTFQDTTFGRSGAAFGVGMPFGAAINVGQTARTSEAATQIANALHGRSAANAAQGIGSGLLDARAWEDQRAGGAVTAVNRAGLGLLSLLNKPIEFAGDYMEAQARYVRENAGSNPLAAVAGVVPVGGLGLVAALDPKWREGLGEAQAAQSSPGQTLWLGVKSHLHPDSQAPADDPFALLDDPNRYLEREEYFSGGMARWTSGVIDFSVNMAADPLMLAGVVAKPALASARAIKATDVAAASRATFTPLQLGAAPKSLNLTRGGRKVVAQVNRTAAALMDATTRPGGLAEISRSKFMVQSGDGGAIPYMTQRLLQNPDFKGNAYESIQRLLYAGMGDRPSLAWLREQDELLEIELRALQQPDKGMVVYDILTSNRYDHLSALRAANADGDVDRVIEIVKDDILATRQGFQRVHAIGSPASEGMEAVGAGGLGTIREIPLRDQMRVAGVINRGLGLPPIHVLWGRKLPGHFSLSADDAYDSLASAVMRTAGRLQKKSDVNNVYRSLLDEFATSYGVFDEGAARATRRDIVDRFNHEATEDLVAKYAGVGGKTEAEIRAAILKIRQRREAGMIHLHERAQGARDDLLSVRDSSGEVLVFDPEFSRPFGATMLEDLVSIPDYRQIGSMLRKEFRDGFQGFLTKAADGTIDVADEFLTATTQLWTFGQLARPGYAIRNAVDSQSRNLAMMGAMESAQNAINGARNLMYNMGKASADEIDRVHALVYARAARAQLDDAIFPTGTPARIVNERNALDDLINTLETGGHGPRVLNIDAKIREAQEQIKALQVSRVNSDGTLTRGSYADRIQIQRLEAQVAELRKGRDQLINTRVRRAGTAAERHLGMEGNLFSGGPKVTKEQRALLDELSDLETQYATINRRIRDGVKREIDSDPTLSAMRARNAGAVDGGPAWEGGPTLYHGTSKSFDGDQVVGDIYAGSGHENLFGYGFYTTDTPSVALGYSQTSETGAVYSVTWKGDAPPVVLDLEGPALPRLREFIRSVPRYDLSPEKGMVSIGDSTALRSVAGDPNATGAMLLRTLWEAARDNPGQDWSMVYRRLRDELDEMGYDAISHVGGQIVGNTDHAVTIFLDPRMIRTARTHELGPEHVAMRQVGEVGLEVERIRLDKAILDVRTKLREQGGGPLLDTMVKSPVFRDIYDYQRSQASVSLHDSLQQLMQQTYSRWLPEVRGSGQWQHVTPADGSWTGAYLDLVNKRIRNDQGLMTLVADPTNARALKDYYLNTPDGNKVWSAMESRFDSVDELIEFQQSQISMILPTPEARQMVLGAPLTEGQIDTIFSNGIKKPAVGAEMLDTAPRNALEGLANRYMKTRDWWFKHVGEMPEEALSRHPFFVNRKRGHMDALWPVDEAGKPVRLTVGQTRELGVKADKLARRDVANYLFDTSSRSNLSSYLRFMSPFYSAWSDTMRKWMRIIGYNPVAGVVLPKAFVAMNSTFNVVDQDGNRILPNGDIVNDDGEVVGHTDDPTAGSIVIPIPDWLSDKWNGNNEIHLSKSSLNVTLQGEPFWLPSMGPLAAVPANEIILGMFPEQADSTWAKYLLPFGTSSADPLDQARPMWVKNLATLREAMFNAENSTDPRLMQTWAELYAAKVNQVRQGEIPPMSQDELFEQVNREARNTWLMRFFSNWFGFSLQPKSRLEFYRNEWQRYRREYGYEDAETRFHQDYPEYYEATISLSENDAGIAATDESWANTDRYATAIRRNPEYGWMYVGAANLVPGFSQGVYTAQQRLGLRGTKSPQDAIRDVQVNEGWRNYERMQSLVNEELAAREAAGGSASIQANANQDLAEFRNSAIQALTNENPAWGEKFAQGSTGTSMLAFFNEATQAVENHRELALRSDFVVLAEYMDAREQMRAFLDEVGAATVDSPEAPEGLAEFWDSYKLSLAQRDIGFEQMYNRAGLDRDTVARG